ncbi:MAG: SUMF1/EgtB/PvdO family nonheme iron enzyme [Planctomycetes bacterium]|nr:SUMF1/EgtB/PvdO family nonheme iron enzyme [Planctomycetota bacterium]
MRRTEQDAVSGNVGGGDPSAAVNAAPAANSVVDRRPRYDVGELVGSGSQGHVYKVWDRDLSRPVAMKVLRAESAANSQLVWQFYAEARRTGSLEHACIPAVYELGSTTTGEPYFTMRLVQGRTLHDVLQDLRRGDERTVQKYTLTRLVQMLQRIAHALHYAHSKSLVHRDLKPGNIAIADHEEVLILDWGLSKRVEVRPEERSGTTALLDATLDGQLKGTPLYMAPEQARGDADRVDRRTDVFALGAMLYEILSLQPPYEGTTVSEVVREARKCAIRAPSVRAPGRDIPKPLEQTAMRALSSQPDGRHATAAAFAEELQAWLDGSREREARRSEADSLLRVALQVAKRSEELRVLAEDSERKAKALLERIEPWATAAEKSEMWSLEDRAVDSLAKAAQADARVVELASRALAHQPDDPTGRELLARMYLRLHREALAREDFTAAEWLLKMVRFYDDGTVAADLREDARLAVATETEGATATLFKYDERGRRLVAREEISTQMSPAIWEGLPHGRYLVQVRSPSGATANLPALLAPAGRRTLVVAAAVLDPPPEGFVVVPGGTYLCGERPQTVESTLQTFWIGRLPVLLREYSRWLDALWTTDREAVTPHIPWTPGHGQLLQRGPKGFEWCPAAPLADQPIQGHPDLPAVGVSRVSASAYAAWVGTQLGAQARAGSRVVSLPSDAQWEKAARGSDGRIHPWGDRFDPTFCSMAQSSADRAALRPAGTFPADVSPYGARDLAGNVREWTRDDDPSDRRSALARGGAWNLPAAHCRAVTRWSLDPHTRSSNIGFRLVIER